MLISSGIDKLSHLQNGILYSSENEWTIATVIHMGKSQNHTVVQKKQQKNRYNTISLI